MGKPATVLYFCVIAMAVVITTLSGAAMAWDGSYQFFVALDEQKPYILHDQRYIVLVGQGVALLSSQWSDDLVLSRTLFSFAYALIPFAVLLLSWLIVKETAPWLFLWPSFGIGIATLPGQLPMYSEATIAVHLFWPLMLALLVDRGKRWLPVVVVLAIILLLTHPSAIPMLAFASAVAFFLAFQRKSSRATYLLQGVFLALVGLTALIVFLVKKSTYEAEHLNVDVLVESFRQAVFGPALLALALGYLAGAILFAIPILWRGILPSLGGPDRIPALRRGALATVGVAGVVLLARTAIPRLWWGSLDYRFWMLPGTLPFLGLAVLEGAAPRSWTEAFLRENPVRRRANLLLAVVFTVVLSANSLSWLRLTHRLEDTMAVRHEVCIPMSSLDWIKKTALEHWSITAYSLVLQGRHPTQIILPDEACSTIRADGVPIAEWYVRPWRKGWFDLEALDRRLVHPADES